MLELSKMGKGLLETKKKKLDAENRSKKNLFGRFFEDRKLSSEQRQFESQCIIAETKFNYLQQIYQYNVKVEPMKYHFQLVLGILMGILSIVLMIHIFCNVAIRGDSEKLSSHPFLTNMLFRMENSVVSFATIPCLLLIGYYMLAAAWKGNVKLGMRFLVVTFYPLKWKETFSDAFFVNCIVLNLYSMAVT